MMTFPLPSKITCADGSEGELAALIMLPERQQLTHLVVHYRDKQRVVPIEAVVSSDGHIIQLHCSEAEMQALEPFAEEHFIHMLHPDAPPQAPEEYPMGYSPHLMPLDTDVVPLVVEHVPEGELVIHRDAPVEATDGPVGHVSGLQVAQNDKRVTRLTVQAGGLLRKHELSLPFTAVDYITDDGIYLKWNRQTLEQRSERLP